MRKLKPNWDRVKRVYQTGKFSLAELARRHGISRSTLEKRCCRERWRDQMQQLCNTVDESAMEEATNLGKSLARKAASFLQRCLNDDQRFHVKIMDSLAAAEAGDPKAIRTLVSAWRDLIQVTRTTFKLDEPANNSGVVELNVAFMSQIMPELITTADGKSYAEIQRERQLRDAKSPRQALPEPEPVEED